MRRIVLIFLALLMTSCSTGNETETYTGDGLTLIVANKTGYPATVHHDKFVMMLEFLRPVVTGYCKDANPVTEITLDIIDDRSETAKAGDMRIIGASQFHINLNLGLAVSMGEPAAGFSRVQEVSGVLVDELTN